MRVLIPLERKRLITGAFPLIGLLALTIYVILNGESSNKFQKNTLGGPQQWLGHEISALTIVYHLVDHNYRWTYVTLTGSMLGGREMKKSKNLFSTTVASAILVGMVGFQAADATEYVPKVEAQTLHQAPLPGVDGMEMIVKHFGIGPKFVGGKHKHPGPVFVYVLKGELTVNLEGETKTFKAGELYPEDIGASMIGKNLSTTDDLEILVFQVGPIGKPMMIKVED